jgi:hypothetical protein
MPVIERGDDHFAAGTYTGNGSTQTISGLNFQPDFVWIKRRNSDRDHILIDAVRGSTKVLSSNLTNAEETEAASITSFNSDGFTLSTFNKTNSSGDSYVYWAWKANGAGVSNTAGTISSTVSANTTAGFSVVTYVGNNSTSTQTVGHGLGIQPSMVIIKNRDDALNWLVEFNGTGYTSGTALWLNATSAADSTRFTTNIGAVPTSSVFSVKWNGSAGAEYSNGNGQDFVAYCFAPIAGYSAFGSYTGNGSTDGPFVFTGFRPRWVMIKNTSQTASWYLLDTARNTYNVMNAALFPNLSNAENTSDNILDCTSNGFKLRASGTAVNYNGDTFVYACFAENPFKLSLAR